MFKTVIHMTQHKFNKITRKKLNMVQRYQDNQISKYHGVKRLINNGIVNLPTKLCKLLKNESVL